MAAQSLRQVANLQTVFTEGFTAARRLFAALDVEPTITDPADAKALPAGGGGHRLRPCQLRLWR